MSNQSNTKRIARNTLMLYFRQILIMAVSLYTVRIVLNVLGAEDYGIYNVVAGVVTMFGFLSGAMATASQRYFSFDLGKGDTENLKKTFSVTLAIYALLALLIVLLAETVGLWFVYNKLVIPSERLTAAKWIYQAAVASFLFTLITTPYMSAIIAHENMDVYAYVGIVEVALKLGIVFLLKVLTFDKLILYGFLLLCVAVINTSLYRFYCKKKYEECHFCLLWDGKLFKEIFTYTGWNTFGAAVGTFKFQLVNILLNQYFSPVLIAARGIANQVNSAVSSFAMNFSNAVRPQIIKLYAAEQKREMLDFMFKTSRYTFYLMFLLAAPLFFEMKTILGLWLKVIPEYTVLFTQLLLIDVIIDSISYSLGVGVQATGNIKWYQIIVGGLLLLNLPTSWIFLSFGFSPSIVFIIGIIITIIAFLCRLFFLKQLFSFSLRESFVIQNLGRMLLSVVIIVPSLLCIHYFLKNIFFVLPLFLQYFCECLLILIVGFSATERNRFFMFIRNKINGK